MTDDDICRYLLAIRDSEPLFESSFAASPLVDLEARFNAAPSPDAFGRLATWRTLASNSLRNRDREALVAWDSANETLRSLVMASRAPSFDFAQELHTKLDVGVSSLRAHRVFSADEEYLAPERIRDELELMNARLSDPSLEAHYRAFVAYVSMVTIHPFENGNGRTARLLADAILLAGGILPVAFASPISAHVAQLKGGATRVPKDAITTFLEAVERSYEVVLGLQNTKNA